jgi:hypothetical protein
MKRLHEYRKALCDWIYRRDCDCRVAAFGKQWPCLFAILVAIMFVYFGFVLIDGRVREMIFEFEHHIG